MWLEGAWDAASHHFKGRNTNKVATHINQPLFQLLVGYLLLTTVKIDYIINTRVLTRQSQLTNMGGNFVGITALEVMAFVTFWRRHLHRIIATATLQTPVESRLHPSLISSSSVEQICVFMWAQSRFLASRR